MCPFVPAATAFVRREWMNKANGVYVCGYTLSTPPRSHRKNDSGPRQNKRRWRIVAVTSGTMERVMADASRHRHRTVSCLATVTVVSRQEKIMIVKPQHSSNDS